MQDPISDSKASPSEPTITGTEIISVMENVGKIQSFMAGARYVGRTDALSFLCSQSNHQRIFTAYQ